VPRVIKRSGPNAVAAEHFHPAFPLETFSFMDFWIRSCASGR
jgi:hypothetical protein